MDKAKKLCICCLVLLALAQPACAEHASFRASEEPPAFGADYVVAEETAGQASLTVTLAGDCTLGGTEASSRKSDSLVKTVERMGLDYPFSGLLPLFSTDDITLVNLEGVLSDSRLGENKEKNFAFRGPAEFAKMLALGSVEAVNLANNHFDDYGKAGRDATIAALRENGIAFAGNEWLSIYRAGEIKVGLAGIRGMLSESKKTAITSQIALLRNEGCQIIIFSLHAGKEYDKKHNNLQKEMAHYLIDAGADVVAGHHPHVAQGMEIYKNRLIFYSLGNLVFGGNHDPKVNDALVAQVEFRLRNGLLYGLQAVLHPVRFTGGTDKNSFRPVFLTSGQAEDVLLQVQADTAFPLPPLIDGSGVVLPVLPANTD